MDLVGDLDLVLIDDEAAADGKVDAAVDHATGRVKGGESHAVRMLRQGLQQAEDQIRSGIEGQLTLAEEADLTLLDNARDTPGNRRRIDGLGLFALEPHKDRAIGAMPFAGRGQGAVEPRFDPLYVIEPPGFGNRAQELPRCPHRPDSMGARRADTDGIEIEDADRHRI